MQAGCRTGKTHSYNARAEFKTTVDGLTSLHDDTYWLRTVNSAETVENRPVVRLQNEDSLERVYCLSSAFFTASVCTAEREEPRESNEGESGGGESDNENEDSYNDEHEWK
jgi:hypothetical protein